MDLQTVEWDEIRFDVRLLQRVPYEGISRMSTSLRRRHRDRVVRRGSMHLRAEPGERSQRCHTDTDTPLGTAPSQSA